MPLKMGRERPSQCKRQRFICELVAKKKKNHSLQGQIESIAKKTLVFPETK